MVTLLFSIALLALLVGAPRAQAGPLVAGASDCDDQVLEQPFMRWLDPARYVLVPAGTFGKGAPGWKLGGARIVGDNEPWRVHGDREVAAARLEAGDTVTSPSMCVGIEHPTLRFFARNAGALTATLNVEVLFEDSTGASRALPIGTVVGGSSWSPTLPMLLTVNLLPLLPGERTAVAFRFTASGGGAAWLIDDVYVDPYSK